MPGLSDILPKLPQLNDAELNALRVRLAALGTFRTDKESGTWNPQADLIASVICEFLATKGLEHTGPPSLARLPIYKAFAGKCPAIIQYLSSNNRIEQRALLYIGISLLYDNLTEMGIVVSSRTLMQHIHRVPACMNRAFPGYARAGLLRFVIRKANGQAK